MSGLNIKLNEPNGKIGIGSATKKPIELKLETPGDALKFDIGSTAIGGVISVNGKTGVVVLDADDVNAYSKDEMDLKIRSGVGAPTSETIGVLGTIYNDTDTGNKYVCTSISDDEGVITYTWEKKSIPVQGVIEKDNTGFVSGGQVWGYNEQNIVFRRF